MSKLRILPFVEYVQIRMVRGNDLRWTFRESFTRLVVAVQWVRVGGAVSRFFDFLLACLPRGVTPRRGART